MEKERTLIKKYLECDGCGYVLGGADPKVVVSVPFDYPLNPLRKDLALEFHFHAITQRHDCFRYWAHNPRIMEESLKERKLTEQQIDDFMSMMLYREHSFEPGIARPA